MGATFEQQWLEYDYNPFILFSSNAKIISLNSEAQFLLGTVSANEIFKLAQTCASVSFGFKTTFLELEYGRYKFFGLTVGYENETEIGIKLYQIPSFKLSNLAPSGELTNIYTLIDLCISTNSINSKIDFTKEFDPTIPEIMINSTVFIKILNKIYLCFSDNKTIHTKLFLRTGEHIKYEGKKYSIFFIEISADNLNQEKANELKALTKDSNFYIDINKNITINIPMITS